MDFILSVTRPVVKPADDANIITVRKRDPPPVEPSGQGSAGGDGL